MSHLEELYWEYQGLISFMEKYPATYGMEVKRQFIHEEILSHYNEQDWEKVTTILHDLKSDMTFKDFQFAHGCRSL